MQKLKLPGGEIIKGHRYAEEERANVLIRADLNRQDSVSQKIFANYLKQFKRIPLDGQMSDLSALSNTQLTPIWDNLDNLNIITNHWNHLTPEQKYQFCIDLYQARIHRIQTSQRIITAC